MESHPQNPEFRINPENFHPCTCDTICLQNSQLYGVNERPLHFKSNTLLLSYRAPHKENSH